MSSGSKLNFMNYALGRLITDINKEGLRLVSSNKMVSVTDSSYASFFEKLEGWEKTLKLYGRNLKNSINGLEFENSNNKNTPRQFRFSQQQSIDDRLANLKSTQEKLLQAQYLLTELYRRALSPTNLDLINGGAKLGGEGIDFYKDLQQIELDINHAVAKQVLTDSAAGKSRAIVAETRAQLTQQVSSHQVAQGAPDVLAMLSLLVTLIRVWFLEKERQKRFK